MTDERERRRAGAEPERGPSCSRPPDSFTASYQLQSQQLAPNQPVTSSAPTSSTLMSEAVPDGLRPGARPRPGLQAGNSGGRSKSGTTGPPPAASSGSRHLNSSQSSATGVGGPRAGAPNTGAVARPQTNVGARLLKKRQSVSYHTAVNAGLGGPSASSRAPPMPAMGSIPLGLQPGGSQPVQNQLLRPTNAADDELSRTGLDIDLLASDAFKPEDCE